HHGPFRRTHPSPTGKFHCSAAGLRSTKGGRRDGTNSRSCSNTRRSSCTWSSRYCRRDCYVRGSDHARLAGHGRSRVRNNRSEEHTSELQSRCDLVCGVLLDKIDGMDNQIKGEVLLDQLYPV